MLRTTYPTFRSLLARGPVVRVAGVHDGLGGLLAQQAGFDAVWSSSLEVSAARGLPDASLLSMSDYLAAAANAQKALTIPVIADCDTGYGNSWNVVHMVHEYEAAGITAVCIEDKMFPKLNSFAGGAQDLLSTTEFCGKIEAAKASQASADFVVVARTEAMISGLGVDEALQRARCYSEAGADAILVHSKAKTNAEITQFLDRWDGSKPLIVVPTTYPGWNVTQMAEAGVSVVIYANQGLRATISSLRETFRRIRHDGDSLGVEPDIATVQEVFALQRLDQWQKLAG